MTFRTDDVLANGLTEARNIAVQVKSRAQGDSAAMAAGDISGEVVRDLGVAMSLWLSRLNEIRAIPGIGQYAKDQYDDQTYDIALEFTAMTAALQSVVTWVQTNMPADGSGYLLLWKWTEVRMFSPAATAGLRTELDALIVTIA